MRFEICSARFESARDPLNNSVSSRGTITLNLYSRNSWLLWRGWNGWWVRVLWTLLPWRGSIKIRMTLTAWTYLGSKPLMGLAGQAPSKVNISIILCKCRFRSLSQSITYSVTEIFTHSITGIFSITLDYRNIQKNLNWCHLVWIISIKIY